jgi:hypothetical protein
MFGNSFSISNLAKVYANDDAGLTHVHGGPQNDCSSPQHPFWTCPNHAKFPKRFSACPGPRKRFSALSVSHCKSILYGVFVWVRRALNGQKRRFPARADRTFDKDPLLFAGKFGMAVRYLPPGKCSLAPSKPDGAAAPSATAEVAAVAGGPA